MRVLFDTNVILDVLFTRAPHAESAVSLLDYVARKELDALLCATSITTIFYLVEKESSANEARRHISTLLDLFDIAAVTRPVLADALALKFKDYEDAVLHEAARHAGATAIVTRNSKDFVGSKITLYQPAELLRLLRATDR
jgi:predicted nucleic acid-binding protein